MVWIIFFTIFLFVVGAILGSFSGAMIWRLHDFREKSAKFEAEKSAKNANKKSEKSAKLSAAKNRNSRKIAEQDLENSRKMWRGFWGFRTEFSRKYLRKNPQQKQQKLDQKFQHSYCENCGHELAARDLFPIFSFIFARGKCRFCGVKISAETFLIELFGGVIFAISYLLFPISQVPFSGNFANYFDAFSRFLEPLIFAKFVIWLVICLLFLALFFYDFRFKKLPNFFMFPLIFLSLIFAILSTNFANFSPQLFAKFLFALVPVFGIYFAIFVFSKGKFIGFGDVKFGLVVALLTLDWRLAFFVLFFANLLGSLVSIFGVLRGKLSRNSQIAFGPFLIFATFCAVIFARPILDFFREILLI